MSEQRRSVGLHEASRERRAREAFIVCRGVEAVPERQRAIDALPTVDWKGHTLHTIRCHGTRGKGPHDVHVPTGVLWSLISLQHYRCVYHAGD